MVSNLLIIPLSSFLLLCLITKEEIGPATAGVVDRVGERRDDVAARDKEFFVGDRIIVCC